MSPQHQGSPYVGSDESYLNEGIDVQHKGLSPTDDELIDTGNSMRPRKQASS